MQEQDSRPLEGRRPRPAARARPSHRECPEHAKFANSTSQQLDVLHTSFARWIAAQTCAPMA